MSNTPRFEPSGLIPTKEQKDIQLSPARTILIEANAGAAKTTTLALKAAEALARGLAPEELLILTFTKEAQAVMVKRLREIGIASPLVQRIRVETFESFSEQVLFEIEKYRPRKITKLADLKPQVVDAILEVSRRNEERFEGLGLATHNVAVSQFIDAQLALKATMAMLRDFDDMSFEDSAEAIDASLAHFLTFRVYEHHRCGDFDDIAYRGPFDATYDLARRFFDSPSHETPLPSYRLVLCDELHDLNEAAFVILKELLPRNRVQFIGAGDKDQVIYQTLGAHPQYLDHRFKEYDPCLTRLPLTATYRHGPQLAFAVGIFKQKESTSPITRNTEIKQLYYSANEIQECAQKAVASVLDWKKNSSGRCAVLIRDRHQSIQLETAFMHAGIGYQTIAMGEYLEREEILFLRGMIAIALNNLSAVQSTSVRKAIVEALAIYGEVNLAPPKLEEAKKFIADDPDTLKWFFSGQILQSKSAIRKDISDIVQFVQALPPDSMAGAALAEICSRINLEPLIKRIHIYPYEVEVVIKSIQGFIQAATISGKNLKEFSEWLAEAEIFSSKKAKQQAIILDCVANVKGMEFDHVILPFLQAGEFPAHSSDYQGEENLFYVGVTRAKTRLTLISPNDGPAQSPFVKKLAIKQANLKADNITKHAEMAIGEFEAKQDQRTELRVSYSDKDRAKALGAKWDRVKGVWYVPPGVDLTPFQEWNRNT